MSELTMAALGETAQPTQPAIDPFRIRHAKLLREQDAQIRILKDLVEDMRAMNRAALDELERGA
jgi:hypothetical protein